MTADYVESPDQPWLQAATIAWLGEVLEPNWTVLETGCGGSTVFFARRVKWVISFEHDRQWCDRVRRHIAKTGMQRRVDLRLIPQYPQTGLMGMGALPELDLAMIDGRGRVKSVHSVMPYVRAGGWLLLDDAQRDRYQPAIDILDAAWPEKIVWTSEEPATLGGKTIAWRKPE